MKETTMSVCRKHGYTQFAINPDGKIKCKKCIMDAVSKKRHKLKEALVKYKGGKCEICGYNKCIAALEFHHINPDEKDFGISNGNIVSLERLKKEADKEIHYAIWQEQERLYEEEKQSNIEHYDEICKEHNIIKKNSKFRRMLDIEEIKNDIKSKMSYRQISEKYNTPLSTLQKFIYRNKLNKYR